MGVNFTDSEVISFVEQCILDETASDEEIEMYEDIVWSNTCDLLKTKYFNTYKHTLKQMKIEYERKW